MKFWSKVIVHEIRGTNFWDTLYYGKVLSSANQQKQNSNVLSTKKYIPQK